MSGQIREIAEKFAHEYNYSFDPDLYLEDQIEHKYLEAEWAWYPKAGGPASPYSDISTIMISARFPL